MRKPDPTTSLPELAEECVYKTWLRPETLKKKKVSASWFLALPAVKTETPHDQSHPNYPSATGAALGT